MKLIKELGPKGTKSSRRAYGLFECPICKTEVEKPLTHGKRNKSCGNPACRKAVFTPNPHNLGNKNDSKKTDKPHYRNLQEQYRLLSKRYTLSAQFKSFDMFYSVMSSEYCRLKDQANNNKITLSVLSEEPIGKYNCKWEKVSTKTNVDYSKYKEEGLYHSKMLADELGTAHIRIKKYIGKLYNASLIGEFKDETIIISGKRSFPVDVFILTKDDYVTVTKTWKASTIKNKSSSVYLITSCSLTKIGIASDVNKRLGTLKGANASPVELTYSKEINNAAKIEKYLHNKYAENNVHHERFDLIEEQVQEIIEYLDKQ